MAHFDDQNSKQPNGTIELLLYILTARWRMVKGSSARWHDVAPSVENVSASTSVRINYTAIYNWGKHAMSY